ncbi:MAG: hypothetical protein U0984_10790 [Prosthecobacter sp.]|nr:hypothetical protein [Prosthecobacter sp.]
MSFYPDYSDTDVTGWDMMWFRPAAAVPLYTDGWPGGIEIHAVGALYSAAKKVQETLDLGVADATNGNAELQFTAGKLIAPISKTNLNIKGNTVVKIPAGDSSFTLTINASAGTFSGTFLPNWASQAATKPVFKGVLLQKGSRKGGFGYFLSNAKNDPDPESGGVTLSAPQ